MLHTIATSLCRQRPLQISTYSVKICATYTDSKRFCASDSQKVKDPYPTWFKFHFKIPHDSRILPQSLFGVITVLFSLTAFRMTYIGFEWGKEHATKFDAQVERLVAAVEQERQRETNTYIIVVNQSDHKLGGVETISVGQDMNVEDQNSETKQFEDDLFALLDKRFAVQKQNNVRQEK